MEAGTLKIDQKIYIRDLLEAKKMTSCHITFLLITTGSFIFIDQAGNDGPADLAVYQRLVKKLLYLACRT